MTISTYYYPAANGGVEAVPGGPAFGGAANYSGTSSFQVQFQGAGYTKVIYDTTMPQSTVVTFNYGTASATTETLTITAYGNSGQVETTDGTYNYLLSDSPVTVGSTYALTSGGSSQFQFNSAYTTDPTCFVTSTRIRTVQGDVAVEELRVGDRAVTASGVVRRITWIGHRDLAGDFGHALPHKQQPIRIRQGAYGHDLPHRDLLLSPGHPGRVGADADNEGGHLVPAMCLVNGTTVERIPMESVPYWHVELDTHDILLAEGLPAESYLDWGDRAFFSDAPAHALANPDFVAPGLGLRCRPVALDGPVVEAERLRLDAVFAASLAAQSAWGGPDVFPSM